MTTGFALVSEDGRELAKMSDVDGCFAPPPASRERRAFELLGCTPLEGGVVPVVHRADGDARAVPCTVSGMRLRSPA